MPVQVLKTKLGVPPVRSNRVIRPRLFQKLDDGLCQGHSLLLVTAPAGFGKTTLVSDWVARVSIRSLSRSRPGVDSTCHDFVPLVAWLALDESDNDPYRFWTYVLEALRDARRREMAASAPADQPADPQIELGETILASLQSASPAEVEVLVGELINELAGCTKDFLLVLDDYHDIHSLEIHASLSFLIEHQPDNLVLIIVTRSKPPLPLDRLRGRFQLTEFDESDLRFSRDEVRSFLQVTNNLDLPEEAVEALEDRTEGWAAGLQLAALALGHRAGLASPSIQALGAEEVIRTFSGSHRYVLSYLTEEVLKRQPEHIQNFLVSTAFLDTLNADLCAAVIGGLPVENCQRILEFLDDNNLFIVPLDQDRQWFRYHSLFAGLLRSRLEAMSEEQILALRRRARDWYARRGWWEKAVEHALASGDIDTASDWMEEVVREQVVVPPALLKSFPEEALRARPLLAVACAIYASLSHDEIDDEVERWLQAAEVALADQRMKREAQGQAESEEEAKRRALVEGHIMLTRGTVAREKHQYQHALDCCMRALEILPEGEYVARSSAALTLGHAYMLLGESEAAEQAAEQARQYALASRSPARIFVTAFNKLEYVINHNRLSEAEQISLEALRVVEAETGIRGLSVPEAGAAYLGLARIHLSRNELDAAEEEFRRGVKLIQLSGQRGIISDVYFLGYYLALMRHDWEAVQASLRGLENFKKINGAEHFSFFQARVWLALLEEEPEVLPNLLDWTRRAGYPLDSAGEGETIERCITEDLNGLATYLLIQIAFYRLGIASQRKTGMDTIHKTIERMVTHAEKLQSEDLKQDMIIIQALAYHAEAARASGTSDHYRQPLEHAFIEIDRALDMAEPEGIMMPFLIHGRPMAGLLIDARQSAAVSPQHAGFLKRLINCFPKEWMEREGFASPPGGDLVEPLSEREIEVLRLLATGRSNRDIASDLTLALGTVKKHVNNIFGKLGVANRTEAAIKARELGIIE